MNYQKMNIELYLKALELQLNALIKLDAGDSEISTVEQKIDDLIYYMEIKND